MPRNGMLVVDNAHWNAAATKAPDDAEALVVPSNHDRADPRGVITHAGTPDATRGPQDWNALQVSLLNHK